jgi:hypothetical protein
MRPVVIGPFILLTLSSSQAPAQNVPSASGGEVRVTSSLSMSEPLAAADQDALLAKQTAARKTVYEIAGQECKLLLDTIAQECRLESLNVNSNVQNQNFRDPPTIFLNTNSNASFRILLKQ